MGMAAQFLRALPLPSGRAIALRWENPAASEFPVATPLTALRVVRRERLHPRSENDGEIIYDGAPISELVDTTPTAQKRYYYTVFTQDSAATFRADNESTADVWVTADFQLPAKLYDTLPAQYLKEDLPLTDTQLQALPDLIRDQFTNLPTQTRSMGQLQRFLETSLAPFNLVRSLSEGLPQLRNLRLTAPEFLNPAANSLGWESDQTLNTQGRRNEVVHAPQLYRAVGTAPSLWQLVSRYTGWGVHALEYAQHIARTHDPARFNLYSLTEQGGVFRSRDDAGPTLGFGPGNNGVAGAGNVAAELTGNVAEPFSLHHQHKLIVTVDGRPPATINFSATDFVDIAAATALEVANVINGLATELTVVALLDGRLQLQSHTTGVLSTITIDAPTAELVSIHSAPAGRLGFIADPVNTDRHWLIYECADPAKAVLDTEARFALDGHWPDSKHQLSPPAGRPNTVEAANAQAHSVNDLLGPNSAVTSQSLPRRELHYRALINGSWSDSHTLPNPAGDASSPCVTALPTGELFLSWVSSLDPNTQQVWMCTATPASASAATLTGTAAEPFNLRVGDRLGVDGHWGAPAGVEFTSADFINIAAATALEVAAVINSRLPGVTATALLDGRLQLATSDSGAETRLATHNLNQRVANTLGLEELVSEGSSGGQLTFSAPEIVGPLMPGRYDDLHAVTDPAGVVRLFFSHFTGGRWQIATVNWDGAAFGALEVLSESISANREPFAVVDQTNRIWLIWSQQQPTANTATEWRLRRRVFDPLAPGWDVESDLLPPVPDVVDRAPNSVLLPTGELRVLFHSNRGDSTDIWETMLDPVTTITTPPALVTNTSHTTCWPAACLTNTDDLLLLYRADRSVSHGRLGSQATPEPDHRVVSRPAAITESRLAQDRSSRSVDSISLHRQCGTTTTALTDSARLGLRGKRLDLMSYTPAKPRDNADEQPLDDDDLYTRGTVGLYLHPLIAGAEFGEHEQQRLRSVLQRFLPINVRVVLRLDPPVFIEIVYPADRDLRDDYLDSYPYIERYDGLSDAFAASLPDWEILETNRPTHTTVDFLDLTTARRRTFAPDPL